MNKEQAESELMQIYMSLSEEKKKAIDTLIKASQGTMLNCPSCGLEVHSDFSECPRCGEQLQTCGTCRNKSICSICGVVFSITVPEEYNDREISHCPFCGCPMEIER